MLPPFCACAGGGFGRICSRKALSLCTHPGGEKAGGEGGMAECLSDSQLQEGISQGRHKSDFCQILHSMTACCSPHVTEC